MAAVCPTVALDTGDHVIHSVHSVAAEDKNPDRELLAEIVDRYGHIIDEDQLGVCFDRFREAALGALQDPHLRKPSHSGAESETRLADMRLPLCKCLELLDQCELSQFEARFTESVTEALYRHSLEVHTSRASASPELQRSVPLFIPDDTQVPGQSSVFSLRWILPKGLDIPAAFASRGPTNQDLAPFKKGPHSPLSFEEFVLVLSMAKSDEIKPKTLPWFPFDPDSLPKQTWDFVVMAFLMYTTFSVPYMLSFGDCGTSCADADSGAWTPLDIFEVYLDLLFCVDVAVTFCTAYTSRGVYHTNLSKISLHYLRTWFLIDFFGSVPFDKIVMVLARGSSKDLQDRLQPLRLVRILKMARAVRFFRKLSELQQKDTSGHLKHFLSVFRAIFLSLFVAHCLACAFYMVIDRSADNWLGVCPCACGRACTCECARARACACACACVCVVCVCVVSVCVCARACVRAYVC
jgi:hypothetical protein